MAATQTHFVCNQCEEIHSMDRVKNISVLDHTLQGIFGDLIRLCEHCFKEQGKEVHLKTPLDEYSFFLSQRLNLERRIYLDTHHLKTLKEYMSNITCDREEKEKEEERNFMKDAPADALPEGQSSLDRWFKPREKRKTQI